jgi:hypothetical protein
MTHDITGRVAPTNPGPIRVFAATLIAGALVCVLAVFAPAGLVAVGVGVVVGAVALGWAVEKREHKPEGALARQARRAARRRAA